MKIEIRVAWVLRYIGSSTTCTSTILPSAGAITYCSPRGPVRDGSRKKTSSHTATRSRGISSAHRPRPQVATPHAPSATSAQPVMMNGQPSGASLTGERQRGRRNAEGGTAAQGRSRDDTAPYVPRSTFRVPRSSRSLQDLPGDPPICFQVPLARRMHDLTWQGWRRCVAVPLALLLQTRELIAQRLLVEARLAPAGRVPVGGPEPG